jgi:transposase
MKSGYDKLQDRITSASRKIRARRVIIGIEIVHIYAENVSRQLKEDYKNVFFINPLATASNRDQKLLLGLKTDAIDAASIADLLIRGECYAYNLREGLYLELKEKTYWREKKIKMVVKLKNQIIADMDRIYPGLNSKFEENSPLFASTLRGDISKLLRDLCVSPHELSALAPQELADICAKRDYRIKIKKSRSIVNYFGKMLLLPKNVVSVYLKLFKRDVGLLRCVEEQIEEVEKRMVDLVQKTPGSILFNQIKGLSDIMIASYVGCIGNINNYKSAKQIYSMAGLTPKVSQSGSGLETRLGIKKRGNKFLRTILYKMAMRVSLHEPYFRDYYYHVKENKSRNESLIAVGNKLNKTMFAMMEKQESFKPPAAGNSKRIRG